MRGRSPQGEGTSTDGDTSLHADRFWSVSFPLWRILHFHFKLSGISFHQQWNNASLLLLQQQQVQVQQVQQWLLQWLNLHL